MPKEPNWGKRGAIATWTVGAFAIGLAILQYVRPPDPAHPMSFDFFSRSIVMPPWLAAIILAVAVTVTAAVVRWRFAPSRATLPRAEDQKTIDGQKAEIERWRSKAIVAENQVRVLVKGKPEQPTPKSFVTRGLTADNKTFEWDVECKLLKFSWTEGISLEIDTKVIGSGLVLAVMNDSPEYIASYTVEVAEANSWSDAHKTFLPNHSFNRRAINSGKNLGPMSRNNAQWLVKELRTNDRIQLSIGDDGNSPLSWPNNNPTAVEIWRLTLGVSYDRLLNLGKDNPTGLPPEYLLIRWDRENHSIAMMKQE